MKFPLYSVYPTNDSTFLSSSEKTVPQQPLGNNNLCTGNFCVIACIVSLISMKIYATVSLEKSLVIQPDLVYASDSNLKTKLT